MIPTDGSADPRMGECCDELDLEDKTKVDFNTNRGRSYLKAVDQYWGIAANFGNSQAQLNGLRRTEEHPWVRAAIRGICENLLRLRLAQRNSRVGSFGPRHIVVGQRVMHAEVDS